MGASSTNSRPGAAGDQAARLRLRVALCSRPAARCLTSQVRRQPKLALGVVSGWLRSGAVRDGASSDVESRPA